MFIFVAVNKGGYALQRLHAPYFAQKLGDSQVGRFERFIAGKIS